MSGESGDCNTPVRRSGRARKPNSRFADDELDGCIKKIVTGVSTPDTPSSSSTPARQRKSSKKRDNETETTEGSTAALSKESKSTVPNVVPLSQAKKSDAIDEGENKSSGERVGKGAKSDRCKERRTRSNAKSDSLEILPDDDKLSGRKISKGKSKGKPIVQSELNIEEEENLKFDGSKKKSIDEECSQTDLDKDISVTPSVEKKLDTPHKKVSDVIENTTPSRSRSQIHQSRGKESPVFTKAQLKDTSSHSTSQGTLEKDFFVKDCKIDFSEAETSTPSRIKEHLNTFEAEATIQLSDSSKASEPEPSSLDQREECFAASKAPEADSATPSPLKKSSKVEVESTKAELDDLDSSNKHQNVNEEMDKVKISESSVEALDKINLDVQMKDSSDDLWMRKGKRNRDQENENDEFSQEMCQDSPESKKKKAECETKFVDQEWDQKRKHKDASKDFDQRKKKRLDDQTADVQSDAQPLDKIEMGKEKVLSESNEEKQDTKGTPKNVQKVQSDPSQTTQDAKQDVEERRHSSIGNILSFLKRPDFVKKIEENFSKKTTDKSSEGKRREDRNRRMDDRNRRSGSYRRDEGKFRSSSEDERTGLKSSARERRSEGYYEYDQKDSNAETYPKYNIDSGNQTWGSMKDEPSCDSKKRDIPMETAESIQEPSDAGPKLLDCSKKDEGSLLSSVEDENKQIESEFHGIKKSSERHDEHVRRDSKETLEDCTVDENIESSGLTWDDMKDVTASVPIVFAKKVNVERITTKKAGSVSKPAEATVSGDENTTDRRSSSIGNILSFLKRGNQSSPSPGSQDPSQASSASSQVSPACDESRIFSLIESTRKSISTKDEYNSPQHGSQEEDYPEKSKTSRRKERRASRWSSREDTQPYSNSGATTDPTGSNAAQWSGQANPALASFNKWDDVSSGLGQVLALAKEQKEKAHSSTMKESFNKAWNEPNQGTWMGWTDNHSHGGFPPPNVPYSSNISIKISDENDFSQKKGMSEFIESHTEELDQPTLTSADHMNQGDGYNPMIQPSVASESTWPSKDMSLSPERDIPNEKDLNSPPRERPWSPKSNEVVLSPRSRELMSSLRNMEVKLTPQMEELMSQDKSKVTQDIHQSDMKDEYEESSFFKEENVGSYNLLSIPLPGIDSDILKSEVKSKEDFYGNSQSDMEIESSHVKIKDHGSSWRTPADSYSNNKSANLKEEGYIKCESNEIESSEKEGRFVEKNLDDKENLKPDTQDDVEISEEERLEYQRKIQRDLKVKEEKNKLVVEERMKSFLHLKENLYLGDRKKSKRSKEVRRMVCDCFLNKEEIARGEVGCGEDCLNRLLMIECGSRCPLKDRCTNNSFQTFDYADVEVFNAEEKGCGVRVCKEIPAGTFIMEYVGEVFDSREFKRRRKEYGKNSNAHFYFMALKGDLFIDATRKGNISRFINHSCDPNAQTQKWTVNGELRVGFFAQKTIEVGEEICFDYRLERYGREPQRCYCGTAICRGWLGESPDEKTKEEKEEERRQERDRRKQEEKRSYTEDVDLEDEIEKLNTIKLRTRQDVLNLCRLMVRADTSDSRVMLLRLVQSSTAACKRLFMDYHGLSLLWSWMADLGYAYENASIKIEVLKTLECLPITNKTQLTDSRVLGVVERWSSQSIEVPVTGSPPPPPPPKPSQLNSGSSNTDYDAGKKSSDTSEDSDDNQYGKQVSTTVDSSSIDDGSMDSTDVEQEALKSKPNLEGCLAEDDSSDSILSEEKKAAVEPGEGDAAVTAATPVDESASHELLHLHKTMVEMAIRLLELWKDLKEYFRIPKKERIELMKEHEREVEEEIRGLDKDRKEKDKYRRDFDRRRRSPDREKDKDRHSRRLSRADRDPKDDRSSDSPKMSKEQRRQLFEIQVQQEEEEAKQRKMQEEMWTMHVERCRLLGQDPYLTPIFDPTCQFYWDPNTASWHPYSGTEPNIPVPASYGYRPNDSADGSPMVVGETNTPNLDDQIDLATIPLPGELGRTSPTQPLSCQAVPSEGTPPQGARVLTFPGLPAEAGLPVNPGGTFPVNINPSALSVPFVIGEEQALPPPGPITIQLPPKWKMARDSEGHVYFYHVKTRMSQWEPPTLEQQQSQGIDSDSDSSSSDSDSSSTTDSEDFSSDDEEEDAEKEEEEKKKQEEEVTTVETGELCDGKMIRRHRTKKPRSEALVQERVISPVLAMNKEAARKERREAKERAQKEARLERHDDRNVEPPQDADDDDFESVPEKIQKLETVIEKDRSEYREKAKLREKSKSKVRAATAIADNSDIARKSKENFRAKMATYIVSVLNPYRKEDCKIGKITCNEDFKYLARKLTHFVMIKELKQLPCVEDLECNDSVKYKTKDFVRKYMSKYGHEFKRDPTDTKEY